jgi:UDP-glucose 4-epimerase
MSKQETLQEANASEGEGCSIKEIIEKIEKSIKYEIIEIC